MEEEPSNARIDAMVEVEVEGVALERDDPECSSAADRSASCCRTLALAVSIYVFFGGVNKFHIFFNE